MNCDNVNRMIIGSIVASIVLNFFVLFTEILNQQCDKKSDNEREAKDKKISQEIKDLRNRIVVLETQLSNKNS